jgi:hypothetical protein
MKTIIEGKMKLREKSIEIIRILKTALTSDFKREGK